MTQQIVWLDLETTGLEPHEDFPLELGLVLCDDGPGGTFEEKFSFSTTISYGGIFRALVEERLAGDDFVRSMHEKSGLLEEVRRGVGMSLFDLDTYLVALFPNAEPRSLTLGGSSVHFDLSFITAHLPEFRKLLSHRVLDVSALKIFERTHGDPNEPQSTASTAEHRALPDVRFSIQEAKRLRDLRWPA